MSTNSDLQQACFDVTDVVAQGKQIEGPTDQNGCLNGQMWTYCFSKTDSGTALQQRKVKHVLDQWENHLNITFNCIGSQDATIRIIFDSSNESWSIMGCNVIPVRLPYPTMNLSGINDTEDISDTEKRVILDEFSHAVGLGNEPQSPIGEPTPEVIAQVQAIEDEIREMGLLPLWYYGPNCCRPPPTPEPFPS
ncbi:hypothetical protein DFH94DRAFT_681195 [Russula ochroleuca]|uniref:Uncharacterized protein n=1 Tax=Russula ochroleuca TaxID=152965 RepID=A0A9P5TA41_9AGAM|nr:hypothetical protein DFH94DRAFT_681195 [Russula ochroleuca]